MKTILVTGGSGLVGCAIQKVFDTNKHKYNMVYVTSKDCDLSSYEKTNELFSKIKPQYVIHLAACVGGLFKNMNQKVDMFERNLMINYNVVKCSHDYAVEKLIACLSTCIFPDKTTYPINEGMLHNGPPHTSNDAYAYAKRMLQVHCQTYREQYGDNFICIIPTNIYGPNDNYSLTDGHVIPSLIHRCYLAKKENIDFVVKGTGKPLRQFIFSEDLARLIEWVLNEYSGENIILSTSEKEEVSIEHVARLIAKSFDYEERIVFDTSSADGQYKKTADNSQLISLLAESGIKFQFTPIEDGIKKSVEWFIETIEHSSTFLRL